MLNRKLQIISNNYRILFFFSVKYEKDHGQLNICSPRLKFLDAYAPAGAAAIYIARVISNRGWGCRAHDLVETGSFIIEAPPSLSRSHVVFTSNQSLPNLFCYFVHRPTSCRRFYSSSPLPYPGLSQSHGLCATVLL